MPLDAPDARATTKTLPACLPACCGLTACRRPSTLARVTAAGCWWWLGAQMPPSSRQASASTARRVAALPSCSGHAARSRNRSCVWCAMHASCWQLVPDGFSPTRPVVQVTTAEAYGCGTRLLASPWGSAGCELCGAGGQVSRHLWACTALCQPLPAHRPACLQAAHRFGSGQEHAGPACRPVPLPSSPARAAVFFRV